MVEVDDKIIKQSFKIASKQKISPSVLQHQRGRMTENQDEVILGGQVYYITLTAILKMGGDVIEKSEWVRNSNKAVREQA